MPRRDGLLVVGGGFYGAVIAATAAERGHHTVLVEREPDLCLRASFRNQARIHNGYHYPRAFTTAWRSHENYRRFIDDYTECVRHDHVALYAVARTGSMITARQFERFCAVIGSRIAPASPDDRALFAPGTIEGVFAVEEAVLDANLLRAHVRDRLERAGVDVRLGIAVTTIVVDGAGVRAGLSDGSELHVRRLADCTYGALPGVGGYGTAGGLKHEITEIAIIRVPDRLRAVGFTIMDGPFGSVLPFPAMDLHSMTHVRYTPHAEWSGSERDPSDVLEAARPTPRADLMIRDLARFVPLLEESAYVTSLFEVKTVPIRHEVDDARPIVFASSKDVPGAVSILGSKIDNIYDVLGEMDDFLS